MSETNEVKRQHQCLDWLIDMILHDAGCVRVDELEEAEKTLRDLINSNAQRTEWKGPPGHDPKHDVYPFEFARMIQHPDFRMLGKTMNELIELVYGQKALNNKTTLLTNRRE